MTLSRLYCENGNSAGFWVQHRTWANVCAHVQSIGGRRAGALPSIALAAGVAGIADANEAEAQLKFYDIRSGRRIDSPAPQRTTERNYVRIAEPFWYVRPPSIGWGNGAPPPPAC